MHAQFNLGTSPDRYLHIVADATEGGQVCLIPAAYYGNGQYMGLDMNGNIMQPQPGDAGYQNYASRSELDSIFPEYDLNANPLIQIYARPNSGYQLVALTDEENNEWGFRTSNWNIPYLYTKEWSYLFWGKNDGTDPANPLTLHIIAHFAQVDGSGNFFPYSIQMQAPQSGGAYSIAYNGTTNAYTDDHFDDYAANLPLEITATPAAGYEFVGWGKTNAEKTTDPDTGDEIFQPIPGAQEEILSFRQTYRMYCTYDAIIRPIFRPINEDGAPLFGVGSKTFEDLTAATNYATNQNLHQITLLGSGTLPAGNYTIPAGITLLIPNDSTLLPYDETLLEFADENRYTNHPYRTLTLAQGAELTIRGTLCVNAKQSSLGSNGESVASSTVSGDFGLIHLSEGSHITLQSGSQLFAYGYITGEGTIDAQAGATVYENFQITDWRGKNFLMQAMQTQLTEYMSKLQQDGAAMSQLMASLSGMSQEEKQAALATFMEAMAYPTKAFELAASGSLLPIPFTADMVFPLNQYYIQNIESKITFHYGAVEKLSATLKASVFSDDDTHFDPFTFIGYDDGLFRLHQGATLTKYYDCDRDRQVYELNTGEAAIENIKLANQTTKLFFGLLGTSMTAIESQLFTLPIAHNMDIRIKSGATAVINSGLCLLPGAVVDVEQGATLSVASYARIYVYGAGDWNGNNFAGTGDFIPVPYTACAGLTANRTDLPQTMPDATINVDGTMELLRDTTTLQDMINNSDPALQDALNQAITGAGIDAGEVGQDSYAGLYTTDGGANITGEGAVKQEGPCGTDANVTHNSGSGTTGTITLKPAEMQNPDGTTTAIPCEGDTALYFNPETQKWETGDINKEPEPEPVLVSSITISGDNTLAAGAQACYTAEVLPAEAANNEVTWSIVDNSLDLVEQAAGSTNCITAKTNRPGGTITLRATAQDGSNVYGDLSITIPNSLLVGDMAINGPEQITGTDSSAPYNVTFSNPTTPANQTVTWSISDPDDLVTLDATSGTLTAKADRLGGTVTLTATAQDGSGKTATKTITVVRTAPEEPEVILVETITLTATKTALQTAGESTTLSATASPDNADNKALSWSLKGHTNMVDWDEATHTVTLKENQAGGQVIVRVEATDESGVYAEQVITLASTYVPVSAIAVSVSAGETTTLTRQQRSVHLVATITPTNAHNQDVTWTIMQGNTLADLKGNVLTARYTTGGTVVVRATAKDGSNVYGELTLQVQSTITEVTAIAIEVVENIYELTDQLDSLHLRVSFTPEDATNQDFSLSIIQGAENIDPITYYNARLGQFTVRRRANTAGGTTIIRATSYSAPDLHADLTLLVESAAEPIVPDTTIIHPWQGLDDTYSADNGCRMVVHEGIVYIERIVDGIIERYNLWGIKID